MNGPIYITSIQPFYEISYVTDAFINPLYHATENADQELLLCPVVVNNGNQIIPLLVDNGSCPFIQLKRRQSRQLPIVSHNVVANERTHQMQVEELLRVQEEERLTLQQSLDEMNLRHSAEFDDLFATQLVERSLESTVATWIRYPTSFVDLTTESQNTTSSAEESYNDDESMERARAMKRIAPSSEGPSKSRKD
jgi:hypothetical protein